MHSTIRYTSTANNIATAHRVAPYAIAVPHLALPGALVISEPSPFDLFARYASSVPHVAQHHTLCQYAPELVSSRGLLPVRARSGSSIAYVSTARRIAA
eukprot:257448-Rhodomonas_salina.1